MGTFYLNKTKQLVQVLIVALILSFQAFAQQSNGSSFGVKPNNSYALDGTSTATDFNSGAAVIDMGVSPQTEGNALKPYGLIYDLVSNGIPVYWIIKDNKSFVDASNKQDQTDLQVIGTTERVGGVSTGFVDLKSGPFLIPAEFIDQAAPYMEVAKYSDVVIYWNLNSITGAPVRGVITTFPNTLIYPKNGDLNTNPEDTDIAEGFFNRAGIDISTGVFDVGRPTDLDDCDQVYVLSHHSDPNKNWNQTEVNKLYDFVIAGGNTYIGCHDVSIMESLTPTGKPNSHLNFLSTNRLMPYKDNLDDTNGIYDDPPLPVHVNAFIEDNVDYDITAASDPIMQFIGEIHPALNGNSERIFLPLINSTWNSNTVLGIYDPSHPDIPGNSPGEAAIIAYGPAYNNTSYGTVMYQGSHISNKNEDDTPNESQWVGEARLFGNFLLQSALETAPEVTISNVPTDLEVCGGNNLDLTANLDQIPAGTQTYLWEYEILSGTGGPLVFDQTNALTASIDFPIVDTQTIYKITFTLTVSPNDGCSNPIVAKSIFALTVDPPQCIVHIDDCPGDQLACSDGDGGTPVFWPLPDSYYTCCDGDVTGDASFLVEFDLPESMNICWDYSRVQRIGSDNLRVFQSTGGAEVSYTTPLMYFDLDQDVPVTQELLMKEGPSVVFDWTLQVHDSEGWHLTGEVAGENTSVRVLMMETGDTE